MLLEAQRQKPIVIDFETDPIEAYPDYPPRPVGVGIQHPGRAVHYYAWGHPTENNCSKVDARKELAKAFDSTRPLLFHNAKFDLAIAEKWMGMPYPSPLRVRDTLLEAFLYDPNQQRLSLKDLANDLLDMPPEEQDEVREWVMAYVKPKKPSQWGAYIGKAPGKLVGRYCKGDLIRTRLLHEMFFPWILDDAAILEAYARELLLMRELHHTERNGIHANMALMRREEKRCTQMLERTDDWLRKRLKAPGLEVDKKVQLADALESAGLVEEWQTTPTGKRKLTMKALDECCTDTAVTDVLAYRAKLATSLRTFVSPWLAMAKANAGMIHVQWNQVRQASERSSGLAGARTGRLSSNPNAQNLPKRVPRIVRKAREAMSLTKNEVPHLLLPSSFLRNLDDDALQLPNVRSFIVPAPGCVLLDYDYSQQELRILAHYEGGELVRLYRDNPRVDLHAVARDLIFKRTGKLYPRGHVKSTGFGIIYGMGLALLGERIGIPTHEARELRAAYRAVFPGLKRLDAELKRRGREDEPIRTWGGRLNWCEEPAVINGRLRTFEYKLLNTLIQGSAADCTKEAINRYQARSQMGSVLLSVHDQIVTECPREALREEAALLKRCMESVEFDVPMLVDPGYCPKHWADSRPLPFKLEDYV
jgi:DNA polymerase I-like protein with 3'-5' exonuclease and polymerase domains